MVSKKEILSLIPISVFIALAIHLGVVLFSHDANSIPSTAPETLPTFELMALDEESVGFSSDDVQEGVHIINFFASWCTPCKAEHKYLFDLKQKGVTLHGVYFMDTPEKIKDYLQKYKNPYDTVSEENRILAQQLGVMGLPETFIVNKDKKIIFHQRGPILWQDVQYTILPLITKELKKQKEKL